MESAGTIFTFELAQWHDFTVAWRSWWVEGWQVDLVVFADNGERCCFAHRLPLMFFKSRRLGSGESTGCCLRLEQVVGWVRLLPAFCPSEVCSLKFM